MDTNTDEKPVSDDSQEKLKRFAKKTYVRPGRGLKPRLTAAQKAEAAALWRTGNITLDQLAVKFKKRPETFSRLFSEMGIKKGEAAKEHQEKVAREVETRLLNDVADQANRIAKVREEHFKMADALGKLVWQEIVQAKQKNIPLEKLRQTMQTLQLASSTIANVRSELYKILKVEDFDSKEDDDSLPELTVRELTDDETKALQAQNVPVVDELDVEEFVDLPDVEESQQGQEGPIPGREEP